MKIIYWLEVDKDSQVVDEKEMESNAQNQIDISEDSYPQKDTNDFNISGQWVLLDELLEIDNQYLDYLKNEEKEMTWIKLPEQYVKDNYDPTMQNDDTSFEDLVEDAVTDFNNNEAPYSFMEIKEEDTEDYDLPGWEDSDEFAAWEDDSGFSQLLELQMDINNEYFDATIDLDIAGSEDEVDLDSAGLEIENDFLKGVYGTSNTVSMNDFAVNSEDINGVSVDFKEWGVNTFFGQVTDEGTDESDEFIWDYDEDGEIDDDDYTEFNVGSSDFDAYFEQGEEEDDVKTYLFGANTNINLADFNIRAGAAMESNRFELDNTANRGIITLGSDASLEGLNLSLDSAFSLAPWDDTQDMGIALFANADTQLEGVAAVDFGLRWRDENFEPLYENDTIFDDDDDDYDQYVDGLADSDTLAFNLRVDQQLVDLFDGYVSYDRYAEDWRLTVGGGIDDLLVEGLSGSASFERITEDTDVTDTVKASGLYSVAPFELGLDFQMVMLDDDRTTDGVAQEADELTFGANGAFQATENLSLNASFEMVQNLGNYDADALGLGEELTKQTLGFGADFVDFTVMENLTLDAGASYTMVSGYEIDVTGEEDETHFDEGTTSVDLGTSNLELNEIGFNVGLEYVMGRATLGNNFEFTNKTGESLTREGNLFDNTLSLDYTIVENVEFTSSWQERIMRFTESDDLNWSAREIKAGVSIDF